MIKTFEQFNNKQDIDSICEEYNITNYTIRDDGKVDVNGYVYINNMGLEELPLYFGKINGNFSCQNNYLTTLKGSPEEVNGNFNCFLNKLTSLEGGPKIVKGGFWCYRNNLTTLKGAPEEVSARFNCCKNKLTSLDYLPNKYSLLVANDNNLVDVKELIKHYKTDTHIPNNPIYNLLNGIHRVNLDHFYLINPLNGFELSKSLYDEIREDLELEPFDYSELHPSIKLVD